MPFCWDEPAGKRILEVRSVNPIRRAGSERGGWGERTAGVGSSMQQKVEVRPDVVGELAAVRWGSGKLLLRVRARGNTRTLTISDYSDHEQVRRVGSGWDPGGIRVGSE